MHSSQNQDDTFEAPPRYTKYLKEEERYNHSYVYQKTEIPNNDDSKYQLKCLDHDGIKSNRSNEEKDHEPWNEIDTKYDNPRTVDGDYRDYNESVHGSVQESVQTSEYTRDILNQLDQYMDDDRQIEPRSRSRSRPHHYPRDRSFNNRHDKYYKQFKKKGHGYYKYNSRSRRNDHYYKTYHNNNRYRSHNNYSEKRRRTNNHYNKYGEYNNQRSRAPKQREVCKFFNPYFKSGCQNMNCEYEHLSQDEFVIYCKFIIKQTKFDKWSKRKFDDAISFIKRGYVLKARKIFRHLVADYEYDGHCNFWLGRCYELIVPNSRQEFEDADSTTQFYYQKAIAINPKSALYHGYYAEFQLNKGKRKKQHIGSYEYREAKIHLQKALELAPSARFHLQYAKFLDEIDADFVEAKKHYQIALERYSMDAAIRLNYARLLHKMGNLTGSKEEFGNTFKALEYSNPDNHLMRNKWIWPHYHYARLLTDMECYELAKKEFELCLAIMNHHKDKLFSDVYYEYSKLLFNAFNDNDQAYYYANTAIKRAPHKRYYKKLLYKIQDVLYQKNTEQQEQTDTKVQEEAEVEVEVVVKQNLPNIYPFNIDDGKDEAVAKAVSGFGGVGGFGFGFSYQGVEDTEVELADGVNIDNVSIGASIGDLNDGDDFAASIGRLSLSGGTNSNVNGNSNGGSQLNFG